MKFTLNWLKDHLDTDATLDEIVAKLTSIGLEVEGVEDPSEKFAPFKVAYVESAVQHPDADRLQVLMVNTGKETLQVVCGAPNAKAGMKGIFAPVGCYVPGIDVELKKGNIRGQESNGMMVSEREMGLSDEHDGIIELEGDPEIGTPFAKLFGMDDPVIEIGLTPNRPDCAGVRGIARDLAAAGLGTLKPLKSKAVKGSYDSPITVDLAFSKDDADACPLFLGRYVKNVKNGPSPEWLQNRLSAIGLRPISALVDITNYVSYDLCRPLHVFDADKVSGNLTVRLGKKGEKLEALDEKTYDIPDFTTVIADDKEPLALGGIMGGMDSGCTDETTNVFLEVAYFDPARTARSGRALQIVSDARYRFERGIDPAFLPEATEIATQMILDFCGGEASNVVSAGQEPEWKREIEYNPEDVDRLIGLHIPEKEQRHILSVLGFELESHTATPPSWRGDVEGRADLVEEIIRIHGFEHIPANSVRNTHAVSHSAETPMLTKVRSARNALADRGLNECVTWSFMGAENATLFGANDEDTIKALTLLNPINAELDQMRPSILPNLIEAAGRNRDKGYPDNALFEVGPTFQTSKADGQSIVATGIRAGNHDPRHWSADKPRKVDAYDAKADALAVLDACGAPAGNMQISVDAPEWYHPGRSGSLRLGPNIFAYFGEIHPAVLDTMGIRETICGFEVFLDKIPESKQKSTARKLLTLSALQPVSRDFAFLVDANVKAADMTRAAIGADKNLITYAETFDVYEGDKLDAGKKSVALTVTIQPQDKTLTDQDIEALSKKVVENIISKTGGQLRS